MKKNILSLTIVAAMLLFCGNQVFAYWTDTLELRCQASVLYPIAFKVIDDTVPPAQVPITEVEEGKLPAEADGAGDSSDTGGGDGTFNDRTADSETIVGGETDGDITSADGLQKEEAEEPRESNDLETDDS